MRQREINGDRVFDAVNLVLLTIVFLLVLYPLYYVVIASISAPRAVVNGEVLFWPKGITADTYKEVLRNKDILIGYQNSLLIMTVGTALNVVFTTFAAYTLSRSDLYGRNAIMLLITFTMFFGGGIIPNYLLVQQLGLLGSRWALILPSLVSTYNLIIMRTYYQNSIPYELQEAAFIDGASDINILLRIILPLSRPILAVISLYYAVVHWNAYFGAMLYINSRAKYPLQLFLREILIMNNTDSMADAAGGNLAEMLMRTETIKYSVIVVASLPMLALYPFVQKFFVKGVMIGAVKG